MSSTGEIEGRLSRLSPAKQGLLEALRKKGLWGELQHHGGNTAMIPCVLRNGKLPLSFAQERMWVLHQFDPVSPTYSDYVAVRLKGSLDVPVLERSLTEVIRRHEALRTTFPIVEGTPVQVIAPPSTFNLHVIELLDLPSNE